MRLCGGRGLRLPCSLSPGQWDPRLAGLLQGSHLSKGGGLRTPLEVLASLLWGCPQGYPQAPSEARHPCKRFSRLDVRDAALTGPKKPQDAAHVGIRKDNPRQPRPASSQQEQVEEP